MIIGAILLIIVLTILILLPTILKSIGYHPDFTSIKYNFTGKKALIITTSHDTLGDRGKATGAYGSEMTVPYYEFLDAGMTVDFASIQGGKIPIEASSMRYPLASHADKRYLKDEDARQKAKNSLKIDTVDFTEYDIIFMAGGWGAAYDLGYSEVLGEKLTEANAKNILLGSVCHGALGFRLAKDRDGSPLVEGKKMTAVTDKQITELKIDITPLHPEKELRAQNANFVSAAAFKDMFATMIAVDGNIVTGQNQNSGGDAAQAMLKLLNKKIVK